MIRGLARPRALLGTAAVTALLTGLTGAPASAAAALPTSWSTVVNAGSGKCLDVPSASTADSVQLVQYTCNGTAAQRFQVTP